MEFETIKRNGSVRRLAGLGLVGMLLTGCDTQVIGQESPEVERAYQELSTQWWKWIAATPGLDNPIFDETGENCHVGQPRSDVWFLVSSQEGEAERVCEVPYNTSLFFPLAADIELGDLADPDGLIPLLRRLDIRFDAVCEVTVEYNDEILADDPDLLRVHTKPFELSLGEANFRKADPGVYLAGSDGYWAFMTPPEPGVHSLRFGVGICDASGQLVERRGAHYRLIIEEPVD